MAHLKVYDEAENAIRSHRRLESKKAGRDLGADAERDWIERYWRTFYRRRLVQHQRGEVFFEEFGAECFGKFSTGFGELKELVSAVLEQVQQGAENLDVLRWGGYEHLPRNQLLQVLMAVDVNRYRLPPPRAH